MRIICPNCDATYDVPAELIAGRPLVRCVQCTEQWKLGEPRARGPNQKAGTTDDLAGALARIPPEVVGASRTPMARRAETTGSGPEAGAGTGHGIGPGTGPGTSLGTDPETDLAAGLPGIAALAEEPVDLTEPETPAEPMVDTAYDRSGAAEPVLPYGTPRTTAPPSAAAAAAELIRKQTGRTSWISPQTADLIAATGWALSLGLLVGLGWLAVRHRVPIMEAWPPSMRLYMILGLA